MKFKSLKFIFALSTLTILLFTACGKEDIPLPKEPSSVIEKMNIKDATNLFISSSIKPSTSLNSKIISYSISETSTKKLFKITSNGYIEEVTYTDVDGNVIVNNNEPVQIININDNYIYVEFPLESYLVNKSNENVYALNKIGNVISLYNNFINTKSIQTDSFGNIYYKVWDINYGNNPCNLIKLDTSDPDNIIATQMNPTTEFVDEFKVDAFGNILYTGRLRTEISGTNSIFRVRKANGGFYNLSDKTMAFWIGLDGNFYYNEFSGDSDVPIKKLIIDNEFNITETQYSTAPTIFMSDSYLFSFNNKIIYLNKRSLNMKEIYNNEQIIKDINLDGFSIDKIILAAQSNDYLYIACNSNTTLIKINPIDYSYELLLNPGVYDISAMTVSSTNQVIFNALRMADGKQILGQIDSNGNLTILDESNSIKATILERIN